jgi:hypothetical protein
MKGNQPRVERFKGSADLFVIPAKAGIHPRGNRSRLWKPWMPAFAGMTTGAYRSALPWHGKTEGNDMQASLSPRPEQAVLSPSARFPTCKADKAEETVSRPRQRPTGFWP